ncbi:hypothetical protein QL285_070750 [Trifolium repens]|nr:hypothetical protein QL285_070750 [Trifolium repens]
MHLASYLCFKVSKCSNKSFFHSKTIIHWHHPRFISIKIQSPIFIDTPQKAQYPLAPVKAQYSVPSAQKAKYPLAHVKAQPSLAPVKAQYPLSSPQKAQYPLAPKSSGCIGIQKTSKAQVFSCTSCVDHAFRIACINIPKAYHAQHTCHASVNASTQKHIMHT